MKNQSGGQIRQTAGDDRASDFAGHWSRIRIATLRDFASELCAALTYRGAAVLTGMSKEGLRRFVEGQSHPNRSSRQALGEKFLEFNPSGVMATRQTDGEWQVRRPLIEHLAEGETAARVELAQIFALAKRFPEEVPASVGAVQEWMDLQVRGEYWGRRNIFGSEQLQRRRRARAKKPPPSGGDAPGE